MKTVFQVTTTRPGMSSIKMNNHNALLMPIAWNGMWNFTDVSLLYYIRVILGFSIG